jgi:hypothetical protein
MWLAICSLAQISALEGAKNESVSDMNYEASNLSLQVQLRFKKIISS